MMNNSELYTRDHLLIQFMLDNYAPIYMNGNVFVERAYKEWATWVKMLNLEKKEEQKDGRVKKRSTV